MTPYKIDDLNSKQLEAVKTIDGPLLIIAGPGSGKTRVITNRVSYLVKDGGISPYKIIAVTFTNKAAREMKDRLNTNIGLNTEYLTVSTFHSFCAMVLRIEGENLGLSRNFVIYDDTDQIDLIKRVMDEENISPKQFDPRSILAAISNAKSKLLGVDGFGLKKEKYFDEIVHRVYKKYEQFLSQNSSVDFDDLLFKTHTLFENFPSVIEKYQNRYSHVMVDEFQDTNIVQYAIGKKISDKHRNFCVVGDPDQSIYSWRNADIKNILNFQNDYPDAKIVHLEENYRCSQNILDTAKHVISPNAFRVKKDLWTNRSKGELITISEGYDSKEEAQIIVKEISRLVKNDTHPLNDIAIMYRVNAQSREFEEALIRQGLPYQLVGSLRFYNRKEIRDIVSYLKLISNTNDDVSLVRIINTPTRGIGQRTISKLKRLSTESNVSLFTTLTNITKNVGANTKISESLSTKSINALKSFHDMIVKLRESSESMHLIDLIDSLLENTDYKQYILEQSDRSEERWENIQELLGITEDFDQFDDTKALSAFLDNVVLVTDVDNVDQQTDAITLITLHQAKGLEFPVVFIVGLEEGLLPHSRSMDKESEIEEERRLFYVGITRAKEKLYLVRAFRRGFRGNFEPSSPSRFLKDIPVELTKSFRPTQVKNPVKSKTNYSENPNFIEVNSPSGIVANKTRTNVKLDLKTGDKIHHPTFGKGIVTSTTELNDDLEITVAFANGTGVKKLMLSFAPIKKLD